MVVIIEYKVKGKQKTMKNVDFINQIQSDTTAILTETSQKGFIVEPQILEDFINQYTGKVDKMELDLRNKVREVHGWDIEEPTETSPVQQGLFPEMEDN